MAGAAKALGDQVGIAWRLARSRLSGLTDVEFFWEPVAPCWSLRLKRGERASRRFTPPGGIDGGEPAPESPPLTTAAWLVSHMILGTWNWNDIIVGQPVGPEPALPGTASDSVALWTGVVDRFETMVLKFSDDDLNEQVAAWGGEVARAFLVSHVIAEVLHHSAEVGRLRDLYRNRASLTASRARP